LLEQVTRVILELQKQFYPASLIEMRVGREFGTSFKELIDSYGRVADDSGAMPRGWEKLKLPMILVNAVGKGSETPSKEGSSTSQQLPPTTPPTSPQLNPAGQQLPLTTQPTSQQATATPAQASSDATEASVSTTSDAAKVQKLLE